MRTLLSHNQDEAKRFLRAGLNGHYGRTGKDGTRLYLDIDKAELRGGIPLFERELQFGGDIYLDGQGGPEHVGRLELAFVETKQRKLVVSADYVRLDEHVRDRAFTLDLFLGLRAYFRQSDVDHVKIAPDLSEGGFGWAGVFDWDPAEEVANRVEMIERIDDVLTGGLASADRAAFRELRTRFEGPSESWPKTGELRRLQGEAGALGERILRGSKWHGIYKL